MPRLATIKEVIDLLKDGKKILINTPAGMVPITGYVEKGILPTLGIVTDKSSIMVTPDHLFFASNGDTLVDPTNPDSEKGAWVPAKSLKIGDKILHKDGWGTILEINRVEDQHIYDISVGHPCRCYYGNDIVNHNTGKTLLGYHALVETQKKGGIAILVDAEYSFNPQWFRTLGGDPGSIIHFEPRYIEESYTFIEDIVKKIRARDKDVHITVLYDSIAAAPSKFEVDNDIEKSDMGRRAIAHGRGARMLTGLTRRENVTLILINQLRATMSMYGPEMDTIGGEAWKYACSVRIMMKKGKKIEAKDALGKKVVGIRGRLQVYKNRIRAPFAEAEFDIYFDRGIDPISGLFDVLVQEEVIKPRVNDNGNIVKGWWTYKDMNFQKSKFNEVLDKYPELLAGHKLLDVEDVKEITDVDIDDADDADI